MLNDILAKNSIGLYSLKNSVNDQKIKYKLRM